MHPDGTQAFNLSINLQIENSVFLMNFNMKTIIIFLLFLTGCLHPPPTKKIYFFIPMNYTGWVNVIFNDSTSKSKPLGFSDSTIYMIGRNPNHFPVNSNIFKHGIY